MNILINKKTNLVEGINSPSTPFNYSIDLDDSINPTKTIEVQEGEKQKVNENGQPLYEHKVYKTETKDIFLGIEEVLEDTGVPSLVTVQKTDEEGFKLYSQVVYNENGEPTDEFIETTSFVQILSWKDDVTYEFTDNIIGEDEYGNNIYEQIEHINQVPDVVEYNSPIYIEIQKQDSDGNNLYIKEVYETVEETVLDYIEEVTESKIATKYETVIIKQNQVTGTEVVLDEETGEEIEVDKIEEVEMEIEQPVEWIDLDPVMIPNMVTKTFDLKSNYEVFTSEDILQAKYQFILDESQKDYILGDMFIDENDLDLSDEKHSANTGVALLQLLPKGQAKTKNIELIEPATDFKLLEFIADEGVEIYLSGKKFDNRILTLSNPVSSCTIKFVNTTDEPKNVKSYAIGY